MKGYIFLNIDNPLVAWETYRGILISTDQNNFKDSINPSIWFANIIYDNDNVRLINELFFEYIRSLEFSSKISRLRGLYVFSDLDSAQRAVAWGDHFTFENLVEVEVTTEDEPTKVDANWITYASRDADGIITEDYIESIRKYWRGEPFNDKPHWELLINGRAIVYGVTVRENAYKSIKRKMPKSLGTLELSRIAVLLDSDLGHCVPWIIRKTENKFQLSYIMNFEDATNKTFLEKLNNFNGPKNCKDLNPSADLVRPDLQSFFKNFTLSSKNIYGFKITKIHGSS